VLFKAYLSLARNFPAGCDGLFGERLGGAPDLWLAVDAQGFPSLLLKSQASDARSDIELRFVGVRFSRECEVTTAAGGSARGAYTVVRLEENDPELVRLFLRLMEEAFCGEHSPQSNREIGERILELANLFRQAETSTKDIIGLWGELQVISGAASIEGATRCWCEHKNAKYDFVCDGFALEVKSTLKTRREHRFSLEQLRPPGGDLPVFVASVQVVQAQSGKAIFELIDGILGAIEDKDLRMAFLGLCLTKGGEDIYRNQMRFQFLSRDAGVALYDANDVPVPHVVAGEPISNVKFDVCLDALPHQTGAARSRLLAMTGPA